MGFIRVQQSKNQRTMINAPDFLGDGSSISPPSLGNDTATSATENRTFFPDNIACALFASPSTSKNNSSTCDDPSGGQQQQPQEQPQEQPQQRGWGSIVGGMAGSLVYSARDAVNSYSVSNAASSFSSNIGAVNLQPLHSLTKSISINITGKNTLPDKTTASQVLMFRQLLHTNCRPGLRLSRGYEGTLAQRAVLHMPWWERGIEQSKKMIISYDNLITRLWLSGAIMPYEKGGYAASSYPTDPPLRNDSGAVNTLINDRGLPPIPHQYWVDRLGFQQDDPVTDFRSGGVLSLAMLVHIVESCPAVHARFVPKPPLQRNSSSLVTDDEVISLEQIITEDASVLPFGITCINITDMLAKFLMFSKAVDKMDALLSAKPFW
ncbi:hypothetical protein ACHAWX_001719 [Stephanocyclus meneghinianus]